MFKRIAKHIGTALLIVALGGSRAAPAQAQDTSQYVITITQIDTSGFPQVMVYVSVTDAQGQPVTTVPASDFALTENGQPVQLTEVYQAGEQGPVTTVLTIDRSGSMNKSGKLEAAKAAANAFVDLMRPEDQTALVIFNTQIEVAQPLTRDTAALHAAINGIEAFEDTALFDGLDTSLGVLSGVQGRKVILLLSDGLDNSSVKTFASVTGGLEQAETSVYAIGLGDTAIGVGSMEGIDEGALRAIAEQSRGSYTYAPDPSQLESLYQQISTRVQNEYRLTYTSPSALRDGIRRGLEVRLSASAAQTNYNPGGLIPETATAVEWSVFGALALGLIALLALPDALRALGGAATSRGLFKKPSRVKLTGSNGGKTVAPVGGKTVTPDSGKPASPPVRRSGARVKVHGKGG